MDAIDATISRLSDSVRLSTSLGRWFRSDQSKAHIVHQDLLHQLPSELLFEICTYLEPSAKKALALATKDLWRVVDADALDHKQEGRLLSLIARDLPDCLACTRCNRLYVWRRKTGEIHCYCPRCSKAGRTPETTINVCQSSGRGIPTPTPKQHTTLSISLELRDLILRYDRHQDLRWGVPMNLLEHCCKPAEHSVPEWGDPGEFRAAPCIDQQSLLLRVERKYRFRPYSHNSYVSGNTHPSSLMRWLLRPPPHLDSTICTDEYEHLPRAINNIVIRELTRLNLLEYDPTDEDLPSRSEGAARNRGYVHCKHCRTDYLIVCKLSDACTYRSEGPCGLECYRFDLWVTSWHDFGPREDRDAIFDAHTSSVIRLAKVDDHEIKKRRLAVRFRDGISRKKEEALAGGRDSERETVYASIAFAPEVEQVIDELSRLDKGDGSSDYVLQTSVSKMRRW